MPAKPPPSDLSLLDPLPPQGRVRPPAALWSASKPPRVVLSVWSHAGGAGGGEYTGRRTVKGEQQEIRQLRENLSRGSPLPYRAVGGSSKKPLLGTPIDIEGSNSSLAAPPFQILGVDEYEKDSDARICADGSGLELGLGGGAGGGGIGLERLEPGGPRCGLKGGGSLICVASGARIELPPPRTGKLSADNSDYLRYYLSQLGE